MIVDQSRATSQSVQRASVVTRRNAALLMAVAPVGAARDIDPAADHERVEQTIRSALPAAQRAGDEVTGGLLVDRLAVHEKTAWMLHSLTA